MNITQPTKHIDYILIFGSLLTCDVIIETISLYNKNIYVISNNSEEISIIKSKFSFVKTEILDVKSNPNEISLIIKHSLIVISLLPQNLQFQLALLCLLHSKNLISISNLNDDLLNLKKQAIDKGVLFLFECGCNPGIEHIIASQEVIESKKKSYKILKFENWAGAIPAPESMDNPFLYKFTWSPLESLKEMFMDSVQLINNKEVYISEKKLEKNIVDGREICETFNFEGFYTKRSKRYKEIYDLKDVKTIRNGSIRYKGFSFIIQSLKYLGLFSKEKFPEKVSSWKEYLGGIILKNSIENEFYNFVSHYIDFNLFKPEEFNGFTDDKAERYFYFRLTCFTLFQFSPKFINSFSFENLFNRLYSVLIFFNFYNIDTNLDHSLSIYENFFLVLTSKAKLEKTERDLVYMVNTYEILTFSKRLLIKEYTLVLYGKSKDVPYTSVAYLIGVTAGLISIGIINGNYSKELKSKGVFVPFDYVLSSFVMENFKKKNIKIEETIKLKTKF